MLFTHLSWWRVHFLLRSRKSFLTLNWYILQEVQSHTAGWVTDQGPDPDFQIPNQVLFLPYCDVLRSKYRPKLSERRWITELTRASREQERLLRLAAWQGEAANMWEKSILVWQQKKKKKKISIWVLVETTVVPFTWGFAFHSFSYLLSTVIQKYEMENSRSK